MFLLLLKNHKLLYGIIILISYSNNSLNLNEIFIYNICFIQIFIINIWRKEWESKILHKVIRKPSM